MKRMQTSCALPFLEGLLGHLAGGSADLLRNSVLLSLGHLVHFVSSIQAVRPAFTSQPCSVSAT